MQAWHVLLVLILTGWEIIEVLCGSWKGGLIPEGPHEEAWGGRCSSGRYQSPINLVYKKLWRSKVEPLTFINYNNVTTTACNNGHSVTFSVDQECEAGVAAGGLHGLYVLDQLQFRWGSEHTLKDKRYPLEMHLIHYNGIYHNKTNALCHGNGLAIIAVLFCASTEENPAFEPIISTLENENIQRNYGKIAPVTDVINVEQLLPRDPQSFFRYHGSLTYPPCSEIVTWTVLEHISYISKSQLKRFCKVHSKSGKTNHRLQKPLNNRKLYLLTGNQIKLSSNIAFVLVSLLVVIFNK